MCVCECVFGCLRMSLCVCVRVVCVHVRVCVSFSVLIMYTNTWECTSWIWTVHIFENTSVCVCPFRSVCVCCKVRWSDLYIISCSFVSSVCVSAGVAECICVAVSSTASPPPSRKHYLNFHVHFPPIHSSSIFSLLYISIFSVLSLTLFLSFFPLLYFSSLSPPPLYRLSVP